MSTNRAICNKNDELDVTTDMQVRVIDKQGTFVSVQRVKAVERSRSNALEAIHTDCGRIWDAQGRLFSNPLNEMVFMSRSIRLASTLRTSRCQET